MNEELLAWYAAHGRELPWRETNDPYSILVSEVMLQQTQVERVIPRWRRLAGEVAYRGGARSGVPRPR